MHRTSDNNNMQIDRDNLINDNYAQHNCDSAWVFSMKEKLHTFASVSRQKKFQAKLMETERMSEAVIQMYCKITEMISMS